MQAFLADALVAIGSLITVLCGGCTLVFSAILAITSAQLIIGGAFGSDTYAQLFAIGIGITGTLPTAIGIATLLLGRWLRRRSAPPLKATAHTNVDRGNA